MSLKGVMTTDARNLCSLAEILVNVACTVLLKICPDPSREGMKQRHVAIAYTFGIVDPQNSVPESSVSSTEKIVGVAIFRGGGLTP